MEAPRKVIDGECLESAAVNGERLGGERLGSASVAALPSCDAGFSADLNSSADLSFSADLAPPDLSAVTSIPALRDHPNRPVLLLSAHVGSRTSLERMLEGLGLSVQLATTLRAARAALRSAPHAAALIELPVPGLHLLADLLADLPTGHAPPVLTLGGLTLGELNLGGMRLEGTLSVAHPPTPALLRAALAPLLPQSLLAVPCQALLSEALPCQAPLSQALPEQAQRLLLTDLMAKPGILGVTLLDTSGQTVAQQGETLPPHLGRQLILALDTTGSFGGELHGGAMHTAQLEYEHRTLLLARHGLHVIACILRDPSTSSLIRYLLRTRLAA